MEKWRLKLTSAKVEVEAELGNKELEKEIENLKVDINVLTTKVDKLKEAITALLKVSFFKPIPNSLVGLKNTTILSSNKGNGQSKI